jgi:hypothetical protein
MKPLSLGQIKFLLEQLGHELVDVKSFADEVRERFAEGQKWWSVNAAINPSHDVVNTDGSNALPFIVTQEEVEICWRNIYGFPIGPSDALWGNLVNELGLQGIKIVTGRPHTHEPVVWLSDYYNRPFK